MGGLIPWFGWLYRYLVWINLDWHRAGFAFVVSYHIIGTVTKDGLLCVVYGVSVGLMLVSTSGAFPFLLRHTVHVFDQNLKKQRYDIICLF